MASTNGPPSSPYFNITYPIPNVAHVEINRPKKLNAFVEAMWLALQQIFNHLSHDPNIRAIVLSGAGDRAFTAGLDVQAAATEGPIKHDAQDTMDPARKANLLRRYIDQFQACLTAVEKCEKSVICLLHGISIGLAIDLSLCADIRLCLPNTRFSVKEIDIGLAADIGTLSRLPRSVGSFSWCKDVCLTGREFGAEEALRVGFVSEVVGWGAGGGQTTNVAGGVAGVGVGGVPGEVGQVAVGKEEGLTRALELAGLIAQKSPVAALGTKEILNYSRDHSIDDGLRYTSIWNAAMVQTEDVKTAMQAGMRKKKPTFSKL